MNRRHFAAALSWLATLALGRPTAHAIRRGPSPRLDPLGDPLPPRAVARFGTVRFWHGSLMNRIESMAVSPDGRWVATGNFHDLVTLWDAATGQVIRQFGSKLVKSPGYSYQCHGLAFAADGQTLAVARPGRSLNRWELNANRRIVRPGGKIERWEVATGQPLAPFDGFDEPVFRIIYAADGTIMASVDRFQAIQIRDATTGQVRCSIDYGTRNGELTGAVLSADGTILITSDDEPLGIRFWDTTSGMLLREQTPLFETTGSGWFGIAVSSDGRMIAAVGHPGVVVWDVTTGQHLRSIAAEPDWPDGRVRSPDHRHSFGALALAPDGRTLATAGHHDLVRLWDLASGQELARLGSIDGDAVGIAFGPDGHSLIAAGSRGTVRVWDLPTRTDRVRTVGHQAEVTHLSFSPDGQALVSVGDDAVCVFEVATGTLLHCAKLQPRRWREYALSPDGRWLAYQECWEDRRITVIEVATGAVLHHFDQFRQQEFGSVYFQFAPEGSTLIVADEVAADLVFVFLDLPSGQEVRRVVSTGWPHEAEERSKYGRPVLLPGGQTLASLASWRGYDDSLILHDAVTGQFQHRFVFGMEAGAQFPQTFDALACSPDGSLVATVDCGNTLRIWDVRAGGQVRRMTGPSIDSASALSFSRSGKVLASGSCYQGGVGTIQLWDVATGCEVARFEGHQGKIACLAFAPDDRLLASGSRDTTVLLWDVAAWR